MIWDVLIWLLSIVGTIISWFPFEIPNAWRDTIILIVETTYRFDGIIPIGTIWDTIGIIVSFEVSIVLIKLAIMILNYVRGVGKGLDITG